MPPKVAEFTYQTVDRRKNSADRRVTVELSPDDRAVAGLKRAFAVALSGVTLPNWAATKVDAIFASGTVPSFADDQLTRNPGETDAAFLARARTSGHLVVDGPHSAQRVGETDAAYKARVAK